MNVTKEILIDPLSASSLRIEVCANGQHLATATGFPISHGGRFYLVTNWHVMTGRDSETDQVLSPTGAVPDELRIVHHASQGLGNWDIRSEPLFEPNGGIRWLEHSRGREIDVIVLPLSQMDSGVTVYPFDISLADTDMIPDVAMPVAIIGYPYGLVTGLGWPIWKTGHIASDPDIDFDGRPAFLIDATTRGGMSGSPVVLRSTGGHRNKAGWVISMGTTTKWLGIYSGRIHGEAEIGRVWRPHLVLEVLNQAT